MANNQSVRRHLDAFTRGRIIGKLEEGRSVTKPEETGGRQWRNRWTRQATGRPISRLPWPEDCTVVSVARCPVRCVPLTPAHRRRRSLWCREHRNRSDNEWGRVLFTDESRFSLSSDSHRIFIWREREAAIIPRTSLKETEGRYGLAVPFHGRQCTMSSHVSCRTALLESEDIERNGWPARSPDLNLIEYVWNFLGRRLAARTYHQ
ncbi:transposable element Tcb1 transposase [Trichonephila clavipes]|nr:transposable element Tcb1 transposase [Trichonephila clavipes]